MRGGIWSCDLRANERPRKSWHEKGTDRYIDRQIYKLTSQLLERIGLRADSLKILKQYCTVLYIHILSVSNQHCILLHIQHIIVLFYTLLYSTTTAHCAYCAGVLGIANMDTTNESGPHPYWWRVCYQQGLPRLVFFFLKQKWKMCIQDPLHQKLCNSPMI